MGAQVQDPRHNADDGTEAGVSTAGMAQGFASDAVFLIREREGGERGGQNFRRGGGDRVEATLANPEADVLEPEEIVSRQRVRDPSVFARAKEEIERHDKAVVDSTGAGGGRGRTQAEGQAQKAQREGFDP